MKRLFPLIGLLVLVEGCGKSWPEADQKKFLDKCNSEELYGLPKEKVAAYCDCQLATYEKYFKDHADMDTALVKMDDQKLNSLANDRVKCLPEDRMK